MFALSLKATFSNVRRLAGSQKNNDEWKALKFLVPLRVLL